MRIQPLLLLAAAGAAGLGLVIGSDALAKYEEPDYSLDSDTQLSEYHRS